MNFTYCLSNIFRHELQCEEQKFWLYILQNWQVLNDAIQIEVYSYGQNLVII